MFVDVQTILVLSGIETNPGTSQQSLLISHININSITAGDKLEKLQQFVDTNNVHILALTETKLNDNVATCQYKLERFHTPMTRHRDRHGGGVALYMHKSLSYRRLHYLELGDEEWIWARVKLPEIQLIVCCVYLPPNLTSDRFQMFLDNLTEVTCKAKIENGETFILGDLNTGNIYLDDRYKNNSGITSFDRLLKDQAHILSLQQIIEQPTRINNYCSNLRDLIFTTNSNIITDSGTFSSFSSLDHLPIYVTINTTRPTTSKKPTRTFIWDYTNLNAPLLTNLLINTDWRDILNNDIDTATNLFITTIGTQSCQCFNSHPTKNKIPGTKTMDNKYIET